MTVAELRKALEGVQDDTPAIMEHDRPFATDVGSVEMVNIRELYEYQGDTADPDRPCLLILA